MSEIPISRTKREDNLIWPLSISRNYEVKKEYKSIIQQSQQGKNWRSMDGEVWKSYGNLRSLTDLQSSCGNCWIMLFFFLLFFFFLVKSCLAQRNRVTDKVCVKCVSLRKRLLITLFLILSLLLMQKPCGFDQRSNLNSFATLLYPTLDWEVATRNRDSVQEHKSAV